ncbi:sensor histidine kinase [Agromyces sp. SYSU T00194]|uniref:sensor histidine kinase n=1 Tax=Agromyces chitinivorans TaxID=3158560 RepID=UPI003392B974
MSIGVPREQVAEVFGRSLTVSMLWGAWAAIAMAFSLSAATALVEGTSAAWIGFALVTTTTLTLAAVSWRPSVWASLLHLLAGAGATYGIAVLVLVEYPVEGFARTALVAVPWIVIVLTASPRPRSSVAIWWATAGYAAGSVAIIVALGVVDLPWELNVPATVAFVLVFVVRAYDAWNLRSGRREAAGLHRAQRRVREIEIRREFEERATARLHDTALNHLLAIGGRGSGPLDHALRAAILHDLDLIVGRDWSEESRAEDPSVLESAVSVARRRGLEVRVSGTPEVLERLDPEVTAALRDAVTQCLVNVADHSGADRAEVSVATDGDELTVAVVDDGAGFDPGSVPPDRLGLRTSVRGRIEQVGGEVRLWSTPGVGTTVLLAVPEADA